MTNQNQCKFKRTVLFTSLSLLFGQALISPALAQSTDIANVPMAVSNSVTPNVLLVYDNSQSMDAQMNGVMLSGNMPNTRSNIGRTAMRNSMTTYRNAFNWGLMSYGMTNDPPALMSTYSYYLGTDVGMVFTSNCVGYVAGVFNGAPEIAGVSTDGAGRCLANPEPSFGREFITFNFTSDDSFIVDVLYFGGYAGAPAVAQAWAPAIDTANPTRYQWYLGHNPAVSTWNVPADFNSPWFNSTLTPTDAGYIPGNFGAALPNNISRSLYLPRGWGYLSNVTGSGTLNRPVAVDSPAHYNALQALLASETPAATGELKNGAVFTPLQGTTNSAKAYFAGGSSPTQFACQQNFVMMVTDGLPTGDLSGNLWSAADRTSTCNWNTVSNTCTAGAFGNAANGVMASIAALRTTTVPGQTSTNKDGTGAITGQYDVQTYVLALGDTVANASAVSVMNGMAFSGGTERALFAADAAGLSSAITAITDNITAKVGAGAAVAVANAHVTSSDNASYASSYNSGTWSGDMDAFPINVITGLPSTPSLWTSGTANVQLDLRTSADRFIATSVDTPGAIGGVQFQPSSAGTATKLSAAQQTLLNTPSTTDGAAVLDFLRGDRTGETAGTYRARAKLLGDMVNGEPVLVRPPSAGYADAGYAAYKTSQASRTRMVFQGANDGMLHAFEAATGREAWAYVPNLVISGLNNLSRRPGFVHQYYVDGTPVTSDVDFRNVNGGGGGGPDWRTVLIGGLGKGGRGYFGLDITDTAAASEVAVKNKVLWEFPNSVTNNGDRNAAKLNMGYSYGKPIIVKTATEGWVALVTSGYNNGTNSGESGGDGLGHLYVINPKTGDLIKDIPTAGCAATPTLNPCGLAQISAYVASTDIDNTTDYVYGGDLNGNVWRFNLTGNKASWNVSKFTTLKDASSNPQPITTVPELALVSNVRMVFVGTGLYLGTKDIPGSVGANSSSSQTQTMYGLRDALVALPNPLRPALQQQTLTTIANKRINSNNPVNYPVKKGWYIDLPSTGERVNTDPTIALSALVFTSNIPSSTVCQPGGSSWEYFLNLKTGGLTDVSTVPWSGTYLGDALASRPVLIQLPSGKVVSLIRKSDATTVKEDLPLTTTGTAARRISWRELFN